MFNANVSDGKEFLHSRKLENLRKDPIKLKLQKRNCKSIESISLILTTTKNMNNVKNKKDGFAAKDIETKSLKSDVFRRKQDFQRLLKLKKMLIEENYSVKNISQSKKETKGPCRNSRKMSQYQLSN